MFDMGPLRPQTDKRIVQRTINGTVYQFVLRPARERTDFMYRLAILSDLISAVRDAWSSDIPARIMGKALADLSELDRAAVNRALLSAVPKVIQKLSDPQYLDIVADLLGWSQVQDKTTGRFEDLSDENVFERTFGDALMDQFAVAFSALEVNYGDFFRKAMAALPSASAETTAPSED